MQDQTIFLEDLDYGIKNCLWNMSLDSVKWFHSSSAIDRVMLQCIVSWTDCIITQQSLFVNQIGLFPSMNKMDAYYNFLLQFTIYQGLVSFLYTTVIDPFSDTKQNMAAVWWHYLGCWNDVPLRWTCCRNGQLNRNEHEDAFPWDTGNHFTGEFPITIQIHTGPVIVKTFQIWWRLNVVKITHQ